MDPIVIGSIVFAFVFGGALLGMALHAVLPEHHLSAESKYIVKLGVGLVGTMVALLLGLLIASARDFFDSQRKDLAQMSAKIVLLDHVLAHYGPEAGEARAKLREAVAGAVDIADKRGLDVHARSSQMVATRGGEEIYEKILALTPKDETQRAVRAQALTLAFDLGNLRWMMFAERHFAVSLPMLATVIFWLTIIFVSFGLFAPPNATVITSLFMSSLSVSIAIFLILEMYGPYEGWIQVSINPLRAALEQLGH